MQTVKNKDINLQVAYTTLVGRVVATRTKTAPYFKVRDYQTKKEYKVKYDKEFLPLDINDGVVVKGTLQSDMIVTDFPPIVSIPRDEMSISRFVQDVFKFSRGEKILAKDSTKMISEIFKVGLEESSDFIDSYVEKQQGSNAKVTEGILRKFLNKNQLEVFVKNWKSKRLVRQIQLLGLSKKEIANRTDDLSTLYKQLRENPFKVLIISLEKADEIVSRLKLDLPSIEHECGAVIRKILQHSSKKSWMSTPLATIMELFDDFKPLAKKLVKEYGVIIKNDHLYLGPYYSAEELCARFIAGLLVEPPRDPATVNKNPLRPQLSEEQKDAILSASYNHIISIFGKAGTGKTSVIREITENLMANQENYHILSFTGKAVSRINEVLNLKGERSAMTIHSFIHRGYEVSEGDVFIIDEIGMVTTFLLASLIKSIGGKKVRLIFLGDINQLPPISAGYLIFELSRITRLKTIYLTRNYRCKDNSGVFDNIELVLNPPGDGGPFSFVKGGNFTFIESVDDGTVHTTYMSFIEKGFSVQEITVVAPYNKVIAQPNNMIEESVFPPEADDIVINGIAWIVGSRVMVTENCYSVQPPLMNGQEGKIIAVNPAEKTAILEVNDETYTVCSPEDARDNMDYEDKSVKKLTFDNLVKSYVLTIHKSQGSQYKVVIVYLPKGCSFFVNRNMLYTAMSRAEEHLAVIGSIRDIETSVYAEVEERYDSLADLTEEYVSKILSEKKQERVADVPIENRRGRLAPKEISTIISEEMDPDNAIIFNEKDRVLNR